jgi:hypothetical protein
MIKLSNESIKKIEELINICIPLHIDMVLIEDGKISGINDEKSCILLSQNGISDFQDNKICLSRLGILNARLNLLKNGKDFSIIAKENDKKEISQLELSNISSKIQFRCMSPNLMKAPKGINDPANWLLQITKEELENITGAVRVMGAKKVIVNNRSNECTIECYDVNNDVFSLKLENRPIWINEQNDQTSNIFVHYYDANIFIPLLKLSINNDNIIDIIIGELGTISTIAGEHTCTIIPQVEV